MGHKNRYQGWQTRESEEAGTGEVEEWSTEEDINWPGRPPGPAHGGNKGVVGGTRVDGNSNGGVGGARSSAGGGPSVATARDMARDVAACMEEEGGGAVGGPIGDGGMAKNRTASRKCGRWGGRPGKRSFAVTCTRQAPPGNSLLYKPKIRKKEIASNRT